MTTNYDPIAEQYRQSKYAPYRTYIESYTLMNLVGDPSGMTVLELACGEGFYTRMIKQKGAATVLGIDLSKGMIQLAHDQEEKKPLGIEYRVGDARNLVIEEQKDLVVAAYLLNYARDRDELVAMCRTIAECLKQGGRFVTINTNPMMNPTVAPSYRHYGFEIRAEGDLREGMPITLTFFLEDSSFEIENYFLNVATHEKAFRLAGFREIRWHQLKLSPDGVEAHEMDYWKCIMDHPPFACIECVK